MAGHPFKTIIFDFDGTLADTLGAAIDIVNLHHDKLGVKMIEPHDVERYKSMSLKNLLFKEFEIALHKLPFLLKFVRKELAKEIGKIHPYEGTLEMLTQLKVRGYQLGVLTSNSTANVKAFFENNGPFTFDFIHSESTIFGKEKALKKILKKYKLPAEAALYVGDEVRDIEGAHKAAIKIATVTWGYNNKELLKASDPDFLITSPAELLNIL